MKIVMDSDCLIKLTKAGLKEHVCRCFDVSIPELVEYEVVKKGKSYSDADMVADNIQRGTIRVISDTTKHVKGENAAIAAFKHGSFDAICSDDRKFLKTLRATVAPYATPTVLLCLMVRNSQISTSDAIDLLEKLRPYVSGDEYAIAKLKLDTH